MEIKETHNKIISILSRRGPSLPIQISKEMGISSLFVSAFLSELYDEKRIKISYLRVGGSPLYFLEGHEGKLENYYRFMHPKEIETFLLLKNNKVLRDSEQEPAIRVALRSIRDFAIGFKFSDEIYWRYFLVPELEAVNLVERDMKKEVIIKSRPATKLITEVISRDSRETINVIPEIKKVKEPEKEPIKPLLVKKPKKEKQKSNFVLRIIDFINKNGLKIVEERSYKQKEYNCILQVRSELGNIDFLTQAKDKKIISDSDLKKLLGNAKAINLPAFILYTKELSKKAVECLKEYKSVLKAKRIE